MTVLKLFVNIRLIAWLEKKANHFDSSLQIMSLQILRDIREKLSSTVMCTILVDEARDFVNREKLVLALSGSEKVYRQIKISLIYTRYQTQLLNKSILHLKISSWRYCLNQEWRFLRIQRFQKSYDGSLTKFISQTERFNESIISGREKEWGSLS